MTLKVSCPHCGSEQIRSCDVVPVVTGVRSWMRAPDGSLVIDELADDGRTFWDCASDDGFDCANCGSVFPDSSKLKIEET